MDGTIIRETLVNFLGTNLCRYHETKNGDRVWTPKFSNLAIACLMIRGAYLMVIGQDIILRAKESHIAALRREGRHDGKSI